MRNLPRQRPRFLCFEEVNILMDQEEFNKLLEKSELRENLGFLVRTVSDYESRIVSLENRVAVINSKINPE